MVPHLFSNIARGEKRECKEDCKSSTLSGIGWHETRANGLELTPREQDKSNFRGTWKSRLGEMGYSLAGIPREKRWREENSIRQRRHEGEKLGGRGS